MAGRIPQSFINDLLARVDIVDVIDERVPLKKAGKDYQARCPFHDEKTPSFSVSPDKQFYYCFGCQASGTALTFLLEHDRLDFVEAVELLARSVGIHQPNSAVTVPDEPPVVITASVLLAAVTKLHSIANLGTNCCRSHRKLPWIIGGCVCGGVGGIVLK